MTLETRAPAFALYRESVVRVDRQNNPPICVLGNRIDMRVSSVLVLHIALGDEIAFPIPRGEEISGEVSITKGAGSLDIRLIFIRYLLAMSRSRRQTNVASTSFLWKFERADWAFRQFFLPAKPYATISTVCEVPPIKPINQTFTKRCVLRRALLRRSFVWPTGYALWN